MHVYYSQLCMYTYTTYYGRATKKIENSSSFPMTPSFEIRLMPMTKDRRLGRPSRWHEQLRRYKTRYYIPVLFRIPIEKRRRKVVSKTSATKESKYIIAIEGKMTLMLRKISAEIHVVQG